MVIYTPVPSTRSSSFIIPASSSDEYLNVIDYDGYDSPPPHDERIANIRNERRYRLLLTHDYHPSRRSSIWQVVLESSFIFTIVFLLVTLPLWDPSPVEVGAVGYLSKPQGRFVTLFNALTPGKATSPGVQSLPSIHGYGPTQVETHRQDRRTVAQKGIDAFAGLLTFRTSSYVMLWLPLTKIVWLTLVSYSEKVSRRYSYPLKAGHKMAYLCTESTDYRYLEKLDAPKRWFKTNVDFIMQTFASQHHLQKEDLFLGRYWIILCGGRNWPNCAVIGTLSAPNYALFVSHRHPEGHVSNVSTSYGNFFFI